MERFEVGEVLNLGSLMDAVPHTRDAMLSAGANKEALKERLQGFRIRGGAYQGPVGITSVFMNACTKREMDYPSLWGHAAQYVQRVPNWKVRRALIARVNQLLGLRIPLDDLDRRAAAFDERDREGSASTSRTNPSNVSVPK